jgi:DNA-directed RNA polymerase specialized sigma24 family protein
VVKLPALDVIDEPRAFLRTIATRILYKIWRRRDLERACMEALYSTIDRSWRLTKI